MQQDPDAERSTSARQPGISRRAFLTGSVSAAVAVLGLRSLACRRDDSGPAPLTPTSPTPMSSYGDWRDVYRERWSWDRVVKSTHFVNCWYQSNCAWNVYVKDGMVWREEQVAQYPQVNPNLPDPNPRGCQKGGCYSERMYDATRLRYPLKRVGERGSGRWQRVSWDEALADIADAMLDTLEQDGSDRIVWELGPVYTVGAMAAAHQRLAVLLDSTNLDMNTEIGDGHRGAAETFGKIVFERSADDYFYSDLILIWGGNPLYTQIPNAHYLTEARYHGAKIVCIAPDYSASSVHADLFVPVKAGCDAALALSVAHVLVEDGQIDRRFLCEQTDLPLLVREDTRRFLRAEDLAAGGRDDELFFHDTKRGLTAVDRRSLDLADADPRLEGSFDVTLKDGSEVKCSTVFSLLRARLAAYAPERAEAMCGTPAAVIRALAKLFAESRAASMVTTSNFSKYYHGNLIERCQALVFALSGHYGRKGTGFVAFPFLDQDGFEQYIRDMFSVGDMLNPVAMKIIGKTIADTARWKLDGYTDEMIAYENSRNILTSGAMTSGALFWYVHGGLLEASAELEKWDPYAKRPAREYLAGIVRQGMAVAVAAARQRSEDVVRLRQQSAAPRAQLSDHSEEPVAEAPQRRHPRHAHDLERASLRLRAAGVRVVRAQRAQVGDPAQSVHPRRQQGSDVLRIEIRLGGALAPHHRHRPARARARREELHRPQRQSAPPRQPLRQVLAGRPLRARGRREGL